MDGLSAEEAALFGTPHGDGAAIISKSPDEGPSAGKLFVRDVIYSVDNIAISGKGPLLRAIATHRAGETIELGLVRNGTLMDVPVTLAEAWEPTHNPVADHYEGYLGMTLEMWEKNEQGLEALATPVITHLQSLGPAHKAGISSSQRSIALRGSFAVPYQLDVKTVTGVVIDGAYHPVHTVEDIEKLSSMAFRAHKLLLLEVEYWSRPNPSNTRESLRPMGTAFFKVTPAPSVETVEIQEAGLTAERKGASTPS